MNRRSFLTTLGAAAVLPFIPKAVQAACKAAGFSVTLPPEIVPGIAYYTMFRNGVPVDYIFTSAAARTCDVMALWRQKPAPRPRIFMSVPNDSPAFQNPYMERPVYDGCTPMLYGPTPEPKP